MPGNLVSKHKRNGKYSQVAWNTGLLEFYHYTGVYSSDRGGKD